MTAQSTHDLLLEWKAAHHPHAQILRTRPLSGGVSSLMLAFTLATDEGERELILRVPSASTLARDPGAMDTESRLLRKLQELGVPCPRPWPPGDEEPTSGTRCLVLEFVPGAPLLTPPISTEQIEEMAKRLAAIHDLESARFGDLGLATHAPEPFEPSPSVLVRLEQAFPYSKVLAAFQSLGGSAVATEPSLLHGDYWPGNLLWHEGHLCGIIDWEDCRIGDPLLDLAIARLDLRWIFGVEVMNCFTDLYQQVRPVDAVLLDRWDLFATLRPGTQIETWAQSYPELGRSDIDAVYMQRVRTEHALEVIAGR
jgi:aminoglycoside phosphotransferase (APT) family kinase protein